MQQPEERTQEQSTNLRKEPRNHATSWKWKYSGTMQQPVEIIQAKTWRKDPGTTLKKEPQKLRSNLKTEKKKTAVTSYNKHESLPESYSIPTHAGNKEGYAVVELKMREYIVYF